MDVSPSCFNDTDLTHHTHTHTHTHKIHMAEVSNGLVLYPQNLRQQRYYTPT